MVLGKPETNAWHDMDVGGDCFGTCSRLGIYFLINGLDKFGDSNP